MSDKSFGDYTNRNIVKNPLLSTAVTGLSLEDLTHNAVLLPVTHSQESITRQDPQIGHQNVSLTPSNTGIPDENSIPIPSHAPHNVPKPNPAPRDAKEDDFDVNEYFARLQGTRYVSAPLNSSLKEDQPPAEENLEEINLNEPEPAPAEVQQSLTADIAQNFSQLPTVLPQVASAVFSSFSNMLYKSRDVTPDERPQEAQGQRPVGQDAHFQRPEEVGVPLMGMDEPAVPREVAPPPREPPVGGTTSYRITTKKKAYAQIPGLSSQIPPQSMSDPAQSFQQPPTNAPPFFTPDAINIPQPSVDTHDNVQTQQAPRDYNIFNPIETHVDNTQPANMEPTFYSVNPVEPEKKPDIPQEPLVPPNTLDSGVPIITPPPMFSNAGRKSYPVGSAILPPSVARRICSQHPAKRQITHAPAFPANNIFIPAPISDNVLQNAAASDFNRPPEVSRSEDSVTQDPAPVPNLPSAFVQFKSTYSTISSMHAPFSEARLNDMNPIPFSHGRGVMPPPPDARLLTPPPSATRLQSPNQPPRMPSPSQIQPPFFNPANLSSSLSAVNAPRRLSIESAVASNTANISKMAPPMPFFNPTNKHSGVMPSGPTLDLTQKGSGPDTSFGIETTQAANIPPPTFFDPNTVQPNQSTESDSVTPQNIMDSYFDQKAHSTESKPIPEPPKLSGALNYRMTKKRPQYYSGPIEGIGSISNYKKPVVPTLDTKAFDGALFTPDQPLAEHQAIPEQSTTPFDISKPAEMTSSYTPFAINSQINNQAQTYIQPDYDTAFDLSRQTTENFDPLNYEVPEQESRGFGIIGSLKSKLSSIDINKIQNSVTTFFDPAYNDTKKETTGNQEYMPYDYSQGPSVGFTSQESNLEIYVPDGDRNPGYNQSFNSENQYHNIYSSPRPGHLGSQTSYLPRHGSGHSHYEHVPKRAHHCHAHAFFQHPSIGHFRHSQDLGVVLPPPQADVVEDIPSARQAFEEAQRPIIQETNPNITNQESAVKTEKKVMSLTGAAAFTDNNFNTYNLFGTTANITPANIDNDDLTQMSLESSALSYFENQPFQPHTAPNNFGSQNVNFDISNNNQELIQESVINASLEDALDFAVDIIQPSILGGIKSSSDLFGLSTHANTDFIQNAFGCSFVKPESIEDISKEVEQVVDKTIGLVLNDDEMKDDIPTVDMAAVPLFGLSSILADKTKEITELEDSIQNVSLQDAKDLKTGLDSNTSASVFDTLSSTAQPLMDEETQGLSELNICETCREIDKPEDANVDDLTVKLIENITSPIQLSNPVAAALTETNTPVEDRTDFNAKQCAEISHITEETMETIQVQSANELLEDVEDITNANTSNYGWSREDTSLVNTEVLVDHNYTFQMDPNAIGFFGNNPMFFENIPNNASDELKAEFKNSHDDSPPVIPISIPSAPPAEDDDSKSDETGGLDVHSIEQDAKKDFPIYEEFVIEPSETDDDKIEYKEKEKCSDEPAQEVDSFTNRVERFKKMEETVDKHDDVFEAQNPVFELPPATSPAVTIASYFDTGNYAAEAHYRNSLSSPSSVPYSRSSPDAQVRLPPGFEDGYKRRLSGVPLQDIDTDLNVPPTIPDTSTQTPVVSTATYSNVSNLAAPVTVSSTMEARKQTPDKLPDFPSVFGRNHESGDSLASSIFGTAEDKKEITASLFSTPQSEKTEQKPLPDPISFFSTGQESTNVESTDSFNRLASYFQTPPKPDHAKSFFELSESQNHYRHALGDLNANCDRIAQNTRDVKDFFNRNDDKKILNIPSDVCSDNLQLIKDLTSVQNAVYPKDQVVRTINYFTVEYDNEDIKTKIKPGIKNDVTKDSNPKLEENDDNKNNDKIDNDDDVVMKIITKCAYCCSRDPRNVVTLNKVELDSVDFKFKKSMDSDNSECSKNSGGGGMEERTDDRRREVSVTFGPLDEENEGVAIATENRATSEYTPVRHHWFYRVDFEGKSIWRGFSANDNRALEEAFHSPDLTEETLVATDGGRFDVNVVGRLRIAVYWSDKPTNVRRCSWFYKGATDARYVPYTEPVAAKLEEEYRHGVTTGEWHRRLVLPSNESVVMHGPGVMVHFPQAAQDAFSSTPQSTMRPRVVRRGCDETEIEDPEPSSIDHLLLLCHGVGSACDMRFRSVEEVVDDFRSTSLQLLQSHYRNSYDKGVVNRIEVLPISWHATLHSGETGVDKRLAAITLGSIPKLRSFTNDTVLDVLFYTSPVFCQTIIDTVCAELNRIYRLFTRRNPHFAGRVSLGGHSLGSVILYDLLCHQAQAQEPPPDADRKSFVSGAAGGGQPCVHYPALAFRPAALYALGSPIAMFECIRGVKSLGADFSLPTCKNFFNIFHPYDPIAYRIEPLINAQLGKVKPSLIPHHKGRKRMHLELKDTMARVGADLKQKLLESLKATWTSVWKTQPPPHDGQLEKVVEEEMEKEQLCDDSKDEENGDLGETPGTTVSAGRLNDGRRVDYVLQEAPFEMINEYLFAMSSHVCYWESEDTMLLILREIYDALGVPPDCTVPQHTMTVQRARAAHPEDNETIVMNAAEHPSTSRGST